MYLCVSAMQLQTFIASALLLSGLASAAILPRDNEAAGCIPDGGICRAPFYTPCCNGSPCLPGGVGEGVSVAIHTVFVVLLTRLWRIVLRSNWSPRAPRRVSCH